MNVPAQLKLHGWEILFYIFTAVTLVQLLYYWHFFRRVAFYTKKEKITSQQHPVSVIVCARDEAGNLAHNLPGVLVQTYPTTHEVIVVNDNSVDETKYLLEELKKTFKHLQPVNLDYEAKLIPGKKYPLSIGIKEAKHEVVLSTDADCMPATEFWLQKMQDGYTAGIEIVLGYGSYNKKPGLLNKLIRFETFHTALQYLSYALAGTPYMGVGRNLSYTKRLFFQNKGFSSLNHVSGGDDDLFINKVATRHNTCVVIDPEAITMSEPKKPGATGYGKKQDIIQPVNFIKADTVFYWDYMPVPIFFFTLCLLQVCCSSTGVLPWLYFCCDLLRRHGSFTKAWRN